MLLFRQQRKITGHTHRHSFRLTDKMDGHTGGILIMNTDSNINDMNHDDKKYRCAKCWSYLESDDHYCTNCGTKYGEGTFNPQNNLMEPMYGIRSRRQKVYFCKKCGHQWPGDSMSISNYCPKCGDSDTVTR